MDRNSGRICLRLWTKNIFMVTLLYFETPFSTDDVLLHCKDIYDKIAKLRNGNLSFSALKYYVKRPPKFETEVFMRILGHVTWKILVRFSV